MSYSVFFLALFNLRLTSSTVYISKVIPMQILTLYLTTAVVFLALDIVMLKRVLFPLFSSNLGDWLLDDPRMGPAAIFYLFYVGGVLFFASWPAFNSGNPTQALMAGALLGLLAYGTYEFTNFATLRAWSPTMVMIDVTWGATLTGVSAWAGVVITRAIFG